MVIQEAFNNSVPLIVSDIGGMQEKVKNGIDGLHFRHGSAFDLADKISMCVSDRSIRNKLAANIKTPMTIKECVNRHFSLYS